MRGKETIVTGLVMLLTISNSFAFPWGNYKYAKGKKITIDPDQFSKCLAIEMTRLKDSKGRKILVHLDKLAAIQSDKIYDPEEGNKTPHAVLGGNNACNSPADLPEWPQKDESLKLKPHGDKLTNKDFDPFAGSFMGYLKAQSGDREPNAKSKGNVPIWYRRDFCTGKEQELEKWVFAQRDNSINPVKIFAKATELADGNLFQAALMAHQLLRNYARAEVTRRYFFPVSNSRAEAFFNKFVDIRGDLKDKDPAKFHGDHRGSWYRLFGVMLARFYAEPEHGEFFTEKSCYGGPYQWMREKIVNAIASHYGKEVDPKNEKKGFYGVLEEDVGKQNLDIAGIKTTNSFLDLAKEGYKASPKDKSCDDSDYLVPGNPQNLKWRASFTILPKK